MEIESASSRSKSGALIVWRADIQRETRLMKPYFIAATFIAVLHFVGNHWFIPKGNKKMFDIIHTYISHDEDKGKTRDVHMFLSPDTKVYINYYRKRDSTARKFHIERYEDKQLVYILKANSAEWLGPPDNWRLRNYEIRTFDGIKEELIVGKGKQIDTA